MKRQNKIEDYAVSDYTPDKDRGGNQGLYSRYAGETEMKMRYGKGIYKRLEGGKETTYTGELTLDDVKIYMDGEPDSFIALDRIDEINKTKKSLKMKIVPSHPFAYDVWLQGEGTERLLDDLLVLKPSFKKVWWKEKWRYSSSGKGA